MRVIRKFSLAEGSGAEQSMAGMPQSQFNPLKSRESEAAGFAYKSQESYGTL
ncbi:hypothetical protein GCM10007921_27560 [Tritonibacter mobilis]|nr:hypothetical protein SCH4B_3222 [Ruegeria sp. TrichCH4B]GLP87196.1 hypothetical protein GCM10007921_27560 [Tritonibacter mobilis]